MTSLPFLLPLASASASVSAFIVTIENALSLGTLAARKNSSASGREGEGEGRGRMPVFNSLIRSLLLDSLWHSKKLAKRLRRFTSSVAAVMFQRTFRRYDRRCLHRRGEKSLLSNS